MVIFLIGCGLGGAIALCIAAPFLLPWPLRLQCLVNGQMADPMLGLGPPPGLELREMRLIAVSADHGRVDVVVDGVATGEVPHRATLTRDCCPSSADSTGGGRSARLCSSLPTKTIAYTCTGPMAPSPISCW